MQTISMAAASIVSKFKEVDSNNVLTINKKHTVLKSKAIYGANASGKSNIIKALHTFITIITDSVKDDMSLRNIDSFQLSTETFSRPSFFQASFIVKNVLYRYGFEATNKEIVSEWLFGTPGKKEVPFFTREGKDFKINENQFKEGVKIKELYSLSDNDIARNDALFLTSVKSFNGGLAREVVDFFNTITLVTGLNDSLLHKKAIESLENETLRKQIVELMKLSDTGIQNIVAHDFENADKTEKQPIAITEHVQYDEHKNPNSKTLFFMNSNESEGTKKMFELSPLILHAINEKKILVIDEFDARFHPLLTRQIVDLFNSATNKGSQFIFTTHDTNLLDARVLRRDQICFVEKDKFGGSHLYTLVDFKGVRNDASFEKDYISGKYGAIPFFGDFDTLIGE